jgi:hypothetical protein
MTALIASPEILAHDFATSVHGALEQDQIDATVKALLASAAATAYPATGSVASLLFYLKFQVNVKGGGKTFDGNAGGISTPGGGALFGDVYTDDIKRLYAKTASFQFNATPVYLNINFFDGSSNFLGHLQSGGISTVLGTGGGSGSWS